MNTTPAAIAKTIARRRAELSVHSNPKFYGNEDYDLMFDFVADILRQHQRALRRAGLLTTKGRTCK